MKKPYPLKTILFCFTAILSACLLPTGCGKTGPIQQTGFYFDTVISITLYDATRTDELNHCFELAKQYENYFSASLPGSDISKINAAAGKPVKVHKETIELIKKGLSYAVQSNGKFDITVGNLTKLWDFQSENPKVPDKKALADAAAAVGYRKVSIHGNEVTLADTGAALDLGGIAKGYIADKIKEYLLSQGVGNGLVNLGGNVLAIGEKPDKSAYTIAIQKPFDAAGTAVATVKVKNQSVVTSGIYERYFKQDGRLYHHILDTENGWPYDNGLASVSIICENSVDGDGLSTTCFALGLEKGMALVEALENTEAVFLTADGGLHTSSGMGNAVPFQKIDD